MISQQKEEPLWVLSTVPLVVRSHIEYTLDIIEAEVPYVFFREIMGSFILWCLKTKISGKKQSPPWFFSLLLAAAEMGCGLNKLEKRDDKRPGNIYSTLKRPQVETKIDVSYEYRFLEFTTLSAGEWKYPGAPGDRWAGTQPCTAAPPWAGSSAAAGQCWWGLTRTFCRGGLCGTEKGGPSKGDCFPNFYVKPVIFEKIATS